MDNPEKLATYEYTRHQNKWFFSLIISFCLNKSKMKEIFLTMGTRNV